MLVDVVLRDESGSDAASAVLKRQPSAKALFISGYTNDRLALYPDTHFIPKPFGPEQLARKIREALDDSQ